MSFEKTNDEEPVLNYKPVFQRFVEANEALLDCFAAIDKDSLKGMNQG